MPPPIPQTLEEMLREYITEQRKADTAGALHKILDAFTEHEAKDELRHAEVRGDFKGLSRRVDALESETNKLEKAVEDTGRHELLTLRDDRTWWKRSIVGGIGAFVLAAFSATIAYLIAKGGK